MNSEEILYLIIFILSINFIIDIVVGVLNYFNFDSKVPDNVKDIYDKKEYEKSQKYKKDNFKFELISASFSFVVLLTVLINGYFGKLDSIIRNYTFENEISLSLIFFMSIFLLNDILSLPFQLYRNFVIEEKFGFNKMSISTFMLDKIKGYLITTIIGSIILIPILLFIMLYPKSFWIYSWIVVSLFMVFVNMFYTSLILPLFNKLVPLEEGDLKNSLNQYAKSIGFSLSNIFIINGSKRSNKANAFFSGFGKNKKIVLYDTLIKNHSTSELVAVLAHEVGHYKLNHVITNMLILILSTGLMLFLMSKFLFNSEVSYALGGKISFRHLEIIAFLILYTPISRLISVFVYMKSRKNEYEADFYAVNTYKKNALVSALRKLSKDNLSNLTPHPVYEFINYSHPSLSKRLKSINKI